MWTYDVVWEESDVVWASRWDVYLSMTSDNIHLYVCVCVCMCVYVCVCVCAETSVYLSMTNDNIHW